MKDVFTWWKRVERDILERGTSKCKENLNMEKDEGICK
jgi:hypothetical protein